ncbi:MAG: hypothetical protein P4L41_02945 [Flavipsychrobacter sp.]|nr:hypothetical protein [Flavipsychrobacter sp.]
MTTEALLNTICNEIKCQDIKSLENSVIMLLKKLSNEEESLKIANAKASSLLADIIIKAYSRLLEPFIADALKMMIRRRAQIALVGHPNNALFIAILKTGSVEIYNSFILECEEMHTSDDFKVLCEALIETAFEFSKDTLSKCVQCNNGKEFYPAVPSNANRDIMTIHIDDYSIIMTVVEQYNSIVGRQQIISDLTLRMNLI